MKTLRFLIILSIALIISYYQMSFFCTLPDIDDEFHIFINAAFYAAFGSVYVFGLAYFIKFKISDNNTYPSLKQIVCFFLLNTLYTLLVELFFKYISPLIIKIIDDHVWKFFC